MSNTPTNNPFEALGTKLRQLRRRSNESIADVAGSVEIEPELLHVIEAGAGRPAEEILLLLISHFAAKEDEATKLWELAGYGVDELPVQNVVNDTQGKAQNGVVVLPAEAQIAYTDMVHVMVNNYGVVMNFMQTNGANTQPNAVARVGMSREHALSVLEVLQKTLALHDPKSIPSSNVKKAKDQ